MVTYIQKRFLGSGTYSKVYEAVDQNNNRFALKKIRLFEEEGTPSTALREISILKTLHHPNIIILVEVVHTPSFLTLVFEYMDFDLNAFITHYGFSMDLFEQVIKGVSYIHAMKVVHRDLKPQNILVNSKKQVKIADFGLARSLAVTTPVLSSEVVTLWYRSPELLSNMQDYNYFVDMWSVGCILFEMLTGCVLFKGNSSNEQLAIIHNAVSHRKRFFEYLIDVLGTGNAFYVEIIMGCLDMNVNQRLNAYEIEIMLGI